MVFTFGMQIQDIARPISLDFAALKQRGLESLASPLNAGFSPRQTDSPPAAQYALLIIPIISFQYCFSVSRRQVLSQLHQALPSLLIVVILH